MIRICHQLIPLAVALIWAMPSLAATPTTASIEGVMSSTGGGSVADGTYLVTFALYPSKDAKTFVWAEGPSKVAIKSGRWSYNLGSSKALDPKALSQLKSAWLGVTVGTDPELPRRPLSAAPYALVAAQADALSCSGCVSGSALAKGAISATNLNFNYAGSASQGGPASDLACTGCVSVKELKFDGDIDLNSKSIKAKNATFTGDVAALTVTATKFIGDGSGLTGIKIPSGSCKAGQVVSGIAQDGSLKCVAALDPKSLPADALNEISNDLLTNQFIDKISTNTPKVPIPDNTGAEANSTLIFPDIGQAQEFALAVAVNNTDLSSLALTVLPPNDKKLGWTLCDPCGPKDAKSYTKVFNTSNKPQSGDLTAWIGNNPKGLWNLKAKDTKFCVPQAPGNAQLCNTKDKTDGEILTWSIQIQTLSSKKVAAEGTLLANGGLVLQKANSDPSACNETLAGYIYFNTKLKSLSVCDGKDWIPVVLSPLGSPQNPGLDCKDIFVKRPGATDGNYWIDPDGTGPIGVFQVFCDMQGGGWTRLDETTNFANQVYSEGSKYYNFAYNASNSQIEALKKISSSAKQSWTCASKGVGSQNYYRGWDGKTYPQSSSGTCWHNNNSSTVNGKGEHTGFAKIPLKAWQSVDCGDSSEYCSYNVGPAWLK